MGGVDRWRSEDRDDGPRAAVSDWRRRGDARTVRGDGLPRIHPINAGIVGDRLLAFILDSPKARDLEQDGRYALHAHLDPQAPHELQLRGRAHLLTDATVRGDAVAVWPFEADATYRLFELDIESALLSERPTAGDWPPVYTRWSSRQAP